MSPFAACEARGEVAFAGSFLVRFSAKAKGSAAAGPQSVSHGNFLRDRLPLPAFPNMFTPTEPPCGRQHRREKTMQKRRLGRTALDIAPLVLGGNVFGWTID